MKLLPFPFQILHKVSLNVHPVTVLLATIMADIAGHMTSQFKYIQRKKMKKFLLSCYNTEGDITCMKIDMLMDFTKIENFIFFFAPEMLKVHCFCGMTQIHHPSALYYPSVRMSPYRFQFVNGANDNHGKLKFF